MAQLHDKSVGIIKQKVVEGENKYKCFRVDHKGILWFEDRLVVPKNHELRKQILDEAHLSKFSIHPGSTKMYQDLRQNFWWTRMKREIAKYVAECDTCQRVKASHLKVAGTLQPLPIPSWKWEDISMDSSWAYQIPLNIMIPFGSLSTGSQRPLILFQYIRNIEPRSMQKFISIEVSAYMVYQKPLSRIMVLSLWHSFGSNSKRLSELN